MQPGPPAEQRSLVAVVVAEEAATKPSALACGGVGASEERGNKEFAVSFGRVSGNALYLVP